jgi:DNA-binding CsgD family transcriptional regulator/PAS domain-containing protein
MVIFYIFVAYRRDDGIELATWLRDSLQGKSSWISVGPVLRPVTFSVYLDVRSPAVGDWKTLQTEEIGQAQAFLLVCSPGARTKFPRHDDLYEEIEWWVENRESVAPILVTTQNDARWIPPVVHDRWPNAQFIYVDPKRITALSASERASMTEPNIQRILGGISKNLKGDGKSEVEGKRPGLMSIPQLPGYYTWEKDTQFRYVDCNENYARAAGFESPTAMLGKTDDDMPWRSLADFFREGDQRVVTGKGPPRLNVLEKEIMVDRVANILVTESPIIDSRQECVGVQGCFVDITNLELVPKHSTGLGERKTYKLGAEFGDECLSGIEGEVIKGILYLYSSERIAGVLNISRAEVESHVKSIARKLQCRTEREVVTTAIRAGLPFVLFGPDLVNGSDSK